MIGAESLIAVFTQSTVGGDEAKPLSEMREPPATFKDLRARPEVQEFALLDDVHTDGTPRRPS